MREIEAFPLFPIVLICHSHLHTFVPPSHQFLFFHFHSYFSFLFLCMYVYYPSHSPFYSLCLLFSHILDMKRGSIDFVVSTKKIGSYAHLYFVQDEKQYECCTHTRYMLNCNAGRKQGQNQRRPRTRKYTAILQKREKFPIKFSSFIFLATTLLYLKG